MKQAIKIALAFLVPLLVGITVIVLLGLAAKEPVDLEIFFSIWLICMPIIVGFVTGHLYPAKFYKAGLVSGLSLGLLVTIPFALFVPVLREPWFLLILLGCSTIIAFLSALLAVMAQKARDLLLKERQELAQAEAPGEESA